MGENVLKMHTVTKTHANVMMVSMEMVILNVKVSILNLECRLNGPDVQLFCNLQ